MVIVNGVECDIANMNLLDYIKSKGYKSELIAVEYNREILPRCKYGDTVIADGDEVEIVSFVGGG